MNKERALKRIMAIEAELKGLHTFIEGEPDTPTKVRDVNEGWLFSSKGVHDASVTLHRYSGANGKGTLHNVLKITRKGLYVCRGAAPALEGIALQVNGNGKIKVHDVGPFDFLAPS